MNAIVKLKGFQPVDSIDFGFEGCSADFPAAKRPLQAAGKTGVLPVWSHNAVVRMIDDKPVPIGVVGADYELVQHGKFFGAIEEALRENIRPDLARDPQVRTSVSYDGAWAKREYVFPAFADALQQSETLKAKFGFRVVAWNALDGSSQASLFSGLIDFICTNGVVAGSLVNQQSRRHTSGFDIEVFKRQISEGLTVAQAEVRWLERLANTPLDMAKAEKFLKSKFSERMTERLMAQVVRERGQRGDNLFALLSALTFYSSHADGAAETRGFGIRNTGADHAAKTLHGRELEVQSAIRSAGFRELLAA